MKKKNDNINKKEKKRGFGKFYWLAVKFYISVANNWSLMNYIIQVNGQMKILAFWMYMVKLCLHDWSSVELLRLIVNSGNQNVCVIIASSLHKLVEMRKVSLYWENTL